MKCIYCGRDETQVLESRHAEDGQSIRRRRECLGCNKRFTTYERVRESQIWVIKKDSTREPFDSEKIKKGILRAVEKRPVSIKWVDETLEKIEREIAKSDRQEVTSQEIGKQVLKHLRGADKVAWLRFASVYLEFEDLSDFEKMLNGK